MIRVVRTGAVVVGVLVVSLVLGACGPVADEGAEGGPSVVATTAVLGALLDEVVTEAGADVELEVLMEPGVDPHSFAPSARDAQRLTSADLVVANGLGLEVGLDDLLDSAASSGTEVLLLAPQVDPVPYRGGAAHDHDAGTDDEHADDDHDGGTEDEHADDGHDEGSEEEHADDDHGADGEGADDHGDEDHGDDDHGDGALDPHVWLDPVRVATMAELVADALADAAPAEADQLRTAGEVVATSYRELADELAAVLDAVPADRRAIVTNHDSFGYLADRFRLEVVATVLPGASTQSEPSAADVAALVELLEREQVRAVFTETTASDRVAGAIADDLGDVAVVELYTGSPGPPGSGAETLAGMMRTNVARLTDALA